MVRDRVRLQLFSQIKPPKVVHGESSVRKKIRVSDSVDVTGPNSDKFKLYV